MSALAEWTDETSPSAHLTEVPRPVDRFELPAATLAAAAAAAKVETGVLHEAVRLALSGGPDEEVPGWQEDGLCRGGGDVDSYFPVLGSGREFRSLLDRCAGCPVQSACLASALSAGDRWGIWGGTSENGRRRLRKVLRKAGVMGVTGEDAFLAWMAPGADREPAHRDELLPVGITPRPHQREAVAAVCAEIASGGPCQIAMATASGKTHVGLWVAEQFDARRVLVLVPNLALVAQTAELWQAATSRSIDTLAVCSDTGELSIETTTDAGVVRRFLQHATGPAVVFATYQSSAVLAAAGVPFDLTVADEAHHLAGETGKAFAGVLRGEIPTARTLFMTATPRRFHRHHGDVDLVGMDDEAFGPRVYELNLSDAVEAGVVADYRVIVAAVDRATFDRVAVHPELGDVDPHLLAGAIAVVRAMGDVDLRSCVSFHTRVERARTFASLVGLVAEQLPAATPPGPGWSGYLHGGASMRIRRRVLARLVDDVTWGVVANARTLGEGVDVPTLDSIAIVDPKTSEQDVMQAVGRALRRPGSAAKVGTVLLPVLLTGDPDPDDLLAGVDERSIEIVGGVLRALRAHDADLGSRLDRTRRRVGSPSKHRAAPSLMGSLLRGRAARGLLRSRVQLWLPGGPTGDLAGALSLRLIRESTATWHEAFGRLAAWVDEHGTIPALPDKVPDETGTFSLGAWVNVQRTLRRRGVLAPERIAALESIDVWGWEPRDEQWWGKFDALKEYVERHDAIPARADKRWRGVPVGSFVNVCRSAYVRDGKDGGWIHKFPDRIAALESLPGWEWNTKDAQWNESFSKLERWAAIAGHACPPPGAAVDGFSIERWVMKQRARLHAGSLSAERIDRLRSLPGWQDRIRQPGGYTGTWDENVEIVERWMAEHDAQPPPQTLVLDGGFHIGSWCNKQRYSRRTGRLTAERTARLTSIPGWQWELRVERWDALYDALVAHVRAGGSASCIPQDIRACGINLGNWTTTQRLAYDRGSLSAERVALLEAVPGWRWLRGSAS